MRITVCESAEVHSLDLFHRHLVALFLSDPLLLQAEGHIVQHRQPWKQTMFLKHDDAIRAGAGYLFPIDLNRSFRLCIKARDKVQNR
ncbi:hypothetical protein D3C85_1488540 [compost metagenome]